ncbi:hypothetical protein BZY94_36780 [Burkholderia territorii]|nr:hypothetical protein BZY94_36780 [Burkholderia territorii]
MGGGRLHGAATIPAGRPDLALHRIALRQCPVDIGRIALDPEKPWSRTNTWRATADGLDCEYS